MPTDTPVLEEEKIVGSIMFLWHEDGDKWFWADVSDFDNDGESLGDIYEVKDKVTGQRLVRNWGELMKNPRPGQIFKCKFNKDKTSIWYNPKGGADDYLGRWNNTAEVAEWQTTHEGWEQKRKGEKTMTLEAQVKYHLKSMEPIRRAYKNAPAPVKAQILALVVQWLTTPVKD